MDYKTLFLNFCAIGILLYSHVLLLRRWHLDARSRTFVSGLIYSAIMIIIMLSPYYDNGGLRFDGKTIVMVNAAMFGGPLVAFITAASGIITWLVISPETMRPGIVTLIFSAALGMLMYRLKSHDQKYTSYASLLIVGLSTHAFSLLMALLWAQVYRIGLDLRGLFQSVFIPTLLLYPIANMIVGKLLNDDEEFDETSRNLRATEERYRNIFENSKACIYMLDVESGTILDVNNAAADFWGYPREVLLGAPIGMINTSDQETIVGRLHEVTGENLVMQPYMHRLASGEIRDMEIFTSRIDLNGRWAVLTIAHDVTDRVIAQRALIETQMLLHAIIESTDDFIWVVDPERFGLLMFNKRLSDNFLHTRGIHVAAGMTPEDLYPTQDFVDTWCDLYRRALREGSFQTEYRGRTGPHVMELNLSVLKRDGVITGIAAFGRDITQRKQAESDLITALERAQESDKLKDVFIANISHEIRTPINVILGYSDLFDEVTDPGKAEEAQSMVACIHNASSRLMRTVDLVLNYSSLAANAYQPNFKTTKISAIVGQLRTQYQPLINEKGLAFEVSVAPDLNEIECDVYCLDMALSNLIDNAIKFTSSGSVRLEASINGQHCVFSVSDTGIGISDQYLPRIFDAFSQEAVGYTRPYDGIGLGLTLVKLYTDIHRGKVAVESTKGEGSRFMLTIPLRQST